MYEDNLTRLDAKKILLALKCQLERKQDLPEIELLVWEELTDRFDGILEEIANEPCPDLVPAVFEEFINQLEW